MILLSLGGIAASVTSALPMWRRLVRHASAFGRRTRRVAELAPDARTAPTTSLEAGRQ